jgi:hypothetical protein
VIHPDFRESETSAISSGPMDGFENGKKFFLNEAPER